MSRNPTTTLDLKKLMSKITISGVEYNVVKRLASGRVIASMGGLFEYAQYDRDGSGRGEWWAGSPTVEDSAALREVIEANGGFDHSTVVKEPA